MESKGFFQEEFGYECTDYGFVKGNNSHDFQTAIFLRLKRRNLYPIKYNHTKDDLFDVIEFLYEYCSKPIEGTGRYHNWNNCGWHSFEYDKNSKEFGRKEFRNEVNTILVHYENGYELSENGEILIIPENGLAKIFEAKIENNNSRVNDPVQLAINRFLHRPTVSTQKEAIIHLSSALEYIREDIKKVLTQKDESDLFNIINSFGIRHNNPKQKPDYDEDIFYSWIFYHLLASYYACEKLIERSKK
jgi:hypothetical protein